MTGAEDDSDSAVPIPQAGNEDFVQLFTKWQRRLFLFILAQAPNPVEAEEILQETNLVIWRKSHTYTPGTNFYAWCCRIAVLEVLKSRDRRRRQATLMSEVFSRSSPARLRTASIRSKTGGGPCWSAWRGWPRPTAS